VPSAGRGIGCAASATQVTMEQDLPRRFLALADPGRAARDPRALALLTRRPRGSAGAPSCRAGRISRQATTPGLARVTRGPDPVEARLHGEIRAIATSAPTDTPRIRLGRHGWCVHHKRAERLMGELGTSATTPKRHTRTTRREEDAPIAVLVGQDFSPGAPGRRYVSHITHVRTEQGLAPSPRWSISALAGSWA